MAWTATVTGKNLINGISHVSVEYTDGQDTVSEVYKANAPSASWIPDTVRDKITQLETASGFDIALGGVTPSDPEPPVDPNLTLFRSRCRLLEIVQVMIELGAVPPDHAKVTALINWIANNVSNHFDELG
jgi:hypothetical protein